MLEFPFRVRKGEITVDPFLGPVSVRRLFYLFHFDCLAKYWALLRLLVRWETLRTQA